MKKINLLIFFCLTAVVFIHAQQDAQYTQFMFNKLSLNPAYVVAGENTCLSCLHRRQWVGLEGSPVNQSVNFRLPFKDKNVGLGLSLNRDVIGPSESILGSLIYGYRIDFGDKAKLGVGIQGTLRSYQMNWTSLHTIQSGDGGVPMGITNQMVFNVGTGIYYYTPKFYLGLSIPHLINNDISQLANFSTSQENFSQEVLHAYLMMGVLLDLSKKVQFKPAVLVKYAEHAPFDVDFNGSLIFSKRLWLGASYRMGGFKDFGSGESIDAIVQYQFGNALKLGLAYDFTLSKVKSYNSGTYELMLEYCFAPKNHIFTNPRFF